MRVSLCIAALAWLTVIHVTLDAKSAAAGVEYLLTDLGFLPGGTDSAAYDINSNGIITGSSIVLGNYRPFTFDGTMHPLGSQSGQGYSISENGFVAGSTTVNGGLNAFLDDGTYHNIGTLGGSVSVALGVNTSGKVVGYSTRKSPNFDHAFYYDGTIHDLGATLGGAYSSAYDITDSGNVVGTAGSSQENAHAFLYDGIVHDLGTFGGTGSVATDISTNGLITGNAEIDSNAGFHAFLYDGQLHDLGTLGSTNSYGQGINSNGDVVGFSLTSGGDQCAFVYSKSKGIRDLNALIDSASGINIVDAEAINDSGQIVGIGEVLNGKSRAILLTPVPEPATLTLLALGAIGLLFARRRFAK